MEDNTKKSESKPGHKKKMVSTKKDKNSRGVGDNLGPRAVQPTMTDLPTGNDDFEASSSLQQFVSVDSDYNSYPGHRTRRARQMDERQNREMLSPGNGIPEWPRSFRASPTPSSVPSTNTARQGSVYSDSSQHGDTRRPRAEAGRADAYLNDQMQAGPPGYRLHQAAGIADHVENNSGTSHEYRYGDVTSLDYTGLGTTSRMLSGYRNTNQDLDLGDLHVHTSQAQGPYSYAPDIDVDFGDDRGGESSTERLQCPTGKHPPLNSERLIRECRRDCVPSMWPGPTRRS